MPDEGLLAREPQQERSRRTLERLLAAAHALVAEKELAEISVPAICARAGVSTGAFYGRFESKDAFLEYVFQRRLSDRAEELAREFAHPRWDHASAAEIIATLIEELVAGYRRNPALMRALDTHGRSGAARPELRDAGAENFRLVSSTFARLLGEKTGMPKAQLERRATFFLETAAAIATDRIVYQGRTFVETVYAIPDRVLVAELTRLGRAYLLGDAPEGPFGRPVKRERRA
jgi:AcrR family transcriptional regulator